MKTEIKTLRNKDSLGIFAADLFAELSEKYISENGRFSVALSGGSTPKLLYQKLVDLYSEDVHWNYIDFFWSDERYVPFDHPDSNGGLAFTHLLSPLGIESNQYFPAPTTEQTAHQAALQYDQTLRRYFNAPASIPSFDLIFLGMGDDGHTASLFPETQALQETKKLAVANWIEKFQSWRITFTYPLLNKAKNVVFLVGGGDKATVVKEILKNGSTAYPSAHVKPQDGQLLWLLDADAAKEL
jgi:6-phosphogluconolactonase